MTRLGGKSFTDDDKAKLLNDHFSYVLNQIWECIFFAYKCENDLKRIKTDTADINETI